MLLIDMEKLNGIDLIPCDSLLCVVSFFSVFRCFGVVSESNVVAVDDRSPL